MLNLVILVVLFLGWIAMAHAVEATTTKKKVGLWVLVILGVQTAIFISEYQNQSPIVYLSLMIVSFAIERFVAALREVPSPVAKTKDA